MLHTASINKVPYMTDIEKHLLSIFENPRRSDEVPSLSGAAPIVFLWQDLAAMYERFAEKLIDEPDSKCGGIAHWQRMLREVRSNG